MISLANLHPVFAEAIAPHVDAKRRPYRPHDDHGTLAAGYVAHGKPVQAVTMAQLAAHRAEVAALPPVAAVKLGTGIARPAASYDMPAAVGAPVAPAYVYQPLFS